MTSGGIDCYEYGEMSEEAAGLQSDQLLDARLRRLAKDIEGLAGKDETALRYAREIGALRRRAAAELFSVCAAFVAGVNRLLPTPEVQLDPPEFPDGSFQEDGANLLQINVRGRILQVEFETTPELVSTEDFRIPYTLSGSVRAFNQALLDQDLIEEQLVFYTIEKEKSMWRYFDARTYRSGELDQEYLVGLMEQLL
jgi:hypothetical protein